VPWEPAASVADLETAGVNSPQILINDQTLENATGVGAPPWTWPVDEQVIDLLHKAIYAYATGAAADRLVKGPEGQKRMKSGHYYPQER
jgi:hypothetical protein